MPPPREAEGPVTGPLAGEHPYGEHPSRTLFVRNINSNVEDSELRALFEVGPRNLLVLSVSRFFHFVTGPLLMDVLLRHYAFSRLGPGCGPIGFDAIVPKLD
jgi:hypothetical protein